MTAGTEEPRIRPTEHPFLIFSYKLFHIAAHPHSKQGVEREADRWGCSSSKPPASIRKPGPTSIINWLRRSLDISRHPQID